VGGRLLLRWQARRAALGLGVMVLILIVAVYLPIWGASLSSIQDGLNYFADTLLFAGAALLLAEALPKEIHGHV
jgi:hypothetical protein